MSFTAEVRDELSRIDLGKPCCARAEFAALLRLQGSLTLSSGGRYRVELATENAPVARKFIALAREVYGLKTELTVRKSILHRTNNYLITVPTQPKLAEVLDEIGLIGATGPHYHAGVAPHLIESECCAIAYLRGAFLASGFVADPKGDFHFELYTHSEQVAIDLAAVLRRFEISPKVLERRGGWTVYLKGAEPIVDFLALVGAHKALLRTENVRIVKSMRNDVNRRVNAEIANQAKTTQAALDQLDAIQLIDRAVGLDSLPPALTEFARLRLANPDASLRELGDLSTPPLSKSAINHRMRRLEQMAAKIRTQ